MLLGCLDNIFRMIPRRMEKVGESRGPGEFPSSFAFIETAPDEIAAVFGPRQGDVQEAQIFSKLFLFPERLFGVALGIEDQIQPGFVIFFVLN